MEIPRKYTFATRRNCAQMDLGSHEKMEYFVVEMLFAERGFLAVIV
jgi:hypothetical protein